MILAQYPRWLPIAIFVRQPRTGSGTCKTPGWARNKKKSGFADKNDIKKSYDALKAMYGVTTAKCGRKHTSHR